MFRPPTPSPLQNQPLCIVAQVSYGWKPLRVASGAWPPQVSTVPFCVCGLQGYQTGYLPSCRPSERATLSTAIRGKAARIMVSA